MMPRRLRIDYGIVKVECQGLDSLDQSRQAGHGILLAPNHCRPADPYVIGEVARQAHMMPHIMASSHLFYEPGIKTWLLRRSGAFSVYREGIDRQAISAAINVLTEANRALVLFPEGVITRTNFRLGTLMEGTALIARNAAKKRSQNTPPGAVVIHPVGLRYHFNGDIEAGLSPALDDIERRLSWRPQRKLPLLDRIAKVGFALLALKEIEYLGQPQTGTIAERLSRLIDHLLVPLEQEWLKTPDPGGDVVARVKKLRAVVLPDMVQGEISPEERERRWQELGDMYLSQQLAWYPPDYLTASSSPQRLLETVERYEEDLTDQCRIYRPMTVVAHIGRAIPVPPNRERGADEDPVMTAMEKQLKDILEKD